MILFKHLSQSAKKLAKISVIFMFITQNNKNAEEIALISNIYNFTLLFKSILYTYYLLNLKKRLNKIQIL